MRHLILLALILLIALFANTQTAIKPQVQVVPAKQTPADSGKAMYDAYCASCHGLDAKGRGPAASAMKTAVPDLTMLAKAHQGKYPAFHVAEVLRVSQPLAAHGSSEMPVWGPIFSKVSKQDNAEIHQRIRNLNKYVESLQLN
jgi:mono/diheme cytochrome c family protein